MQKGKYQLSAVLLVLSGGILLNGADEVLSLVHLLAVGFEYLKHLVVLGADKVCAASLLEPLEQRYKRLIAVICGSPSVVPEP